MKRVNIHLTYLQFGALKAISERTHTPVAEIVRHYIDIGLAEDAVRLIEAKRTASEKAKRRKGKK